MKRTLLPLLAPIFSGLAKYEPGKSVVIQQMPTRNKVPANIPESHGYTRLAKVQPFSSQYSLTVLWICLISEGAYAMAFWANNCKQYPTSRAIGTPA